MKQSHYFDANDMAAYFETMSSLQVEATEASCMDQMEYLIATLETAQGSRNIELQEIDFKCFKFYYPEERPVNTKFKFGQLRNESFFGLQTARPQSPYR